jgi:hypothetical protein
MAPSEQFKLNLAKAERKYAEAKAAVLLADTHFALRDAKIAAELARKEVVKIRDLYIRADESENADEIAWLDS